MRAAAWVLMATMMVAAPASADVVLDQLRRDSLATPMTGFERTATTIEGDKPAVVRIDRFDPRARPGQQWTLVSVDGKPPGDEENKAYLRQIELQPIPGFHRLNSLVAGDPTAVERQGPRTVYRWKTLQKGAAPTGRGPDFSERLSAEAIVRTDGPRPVLEQVKVYAAESFSIAGVVRMNKFEALTRYQHGARGHQLASQLTQVDVRVPFRRGGAIRTEASFRPL